MTREPPISLADEGAGAAAALSDPQSRPAIRLRAASKTYREGGLSGRDVQVLDAVDLSVDCGELIAVIGPSGSGKSTLLNLIGTLDSQDAGLVEILGRDLSRLTEDQLAELRNREIGFVFQFHQLLPDFTVLENVEMPGRIGGRRTGELRERASALLQEVGLAERQDFFPSELSGGERQRVALCRALINEPLLLLADEPTGNLDAESGGVVLDILLELRARRQMTTVIVTHNPEIANRCERIVRLEAGSLTPVSGS